MPQLKVKPCKDNCEQDPQKVKDFLKKTNFQVIFISESMDFSKYDQKPVSKYIEIKQIITLDAD